MGRFEALGQQAPRQRPRSWRHSAWGQTTLLTGHTAASRRAGATWTQASRASGRPDANNCCCFSSQVVVPPYCTNIGNYGSCTAHNSVHALFASESQNTVVCGSMRSSFIEVGATAVTHTTSLMGPTSCSRHTSQTCSICYILLENAYHHRNCTWLYMLATCRAVWSVQRKYFGVEFITSYVAPGWRLSAAAVTHSRPAATVARFRKPSAAPPSLRGRDQICSGLCANLYVQVLSEFGDVKFEKGETCRPPQSSLHQISLPWCPAQLAALFQGR